MGLRVICCVGLTPAHIGADTPCLNALAGRGGLAPLQPCLPALTCSSQVSMLTGVLPQEHGIVGNGWHFREQNEVWLWRQSQGLVQAPHCWQGQPWRVLKHFWWYAMATDTCASVTPRPAYHHDGRKGPDCYAWPPELKATLTQAHGTFPLFRFWGPATSVASSRWIAESFGTAMQHSRADLGLCYLPHLDYDLQRHGPSGAHLGRNLQELDACVARVLADAEAAGDRALIVSEYGIEAVSAGCPINRFLLERGYLQLIRNATGSLIDFAHSRAFAVADHQIAHISVNDPALLPGLRRELSEELPGIGQLYAGRERAAIGLDHPRSGDLIALAERGSWFMHDWWQDPADRPDFAQCVEIHKKPGYDPRELHFDPHGGKRRAALALLRKKLGLRYQMNAITADPRLVRGSHGLAPSSPELGPLLICDAPDLLTGRRWQQTDVAGLIAQLMQA